ncbi:DEAD/DEAH box helicase family protein [Streptomyces sp. NPDC014006]|uniref:DEAD/DEAH box helicase family protein n=1 Tax=Streptomyces sp. NPDC014006 TaxID=3364870 RepID=UPI0036F8EC3A
MATGSGKTLVAMRSAEALQAGRVLVLVPSLDLLAQTGAAWREGGPSEPMSGVSSLRGPEASFPNTTDVDELVAWARPLEKVTVLATYAYLGLGTLERAHAARPAGVEPDRRGRGAPGFGQQDREAYISRTYRVPASCARCTTPVCSIVKCG